MAHLRAVPSDPDDDPVVVEGTPDGADTDAVAAGPRDGAEHGPDGRLGGGLEGGLEGDGETLPEEEPRTYPSTIGGAFYLSILGVSTVAIVIAVHSDWRLGIQVLGGALVVAALLRLVLNHRDAGMLAVRNRFVDAFLLGAAGTALLVLATSIPNMPSA